LAEDNAINQVLVVRLLEKMGHIPTTVVNGRQALEALERERFDLVLMDVQMPEMDGFSATREIRNAERQTASRIPIIALTAHAMKGDEEACLEAGMDGYLSKPVSGKRLDEALTHPHLCRREPVRARHRRARPQEHNNYGSVSADQENPKPKLITDEHG
jgi:two-component system, sensor histidine kinase and response regulator